TRSRNMNISAKAVRLAGGLAIGTIAVVAGLMPGEASADDMTLKLVGTIPRVCTVSFTNTANATFNATQSKTAYKVADVVETCNDSNGYKIGLSSTNGSKLVNTSFTSDSISYTASYNGGGAVPLRTTDQTVGDYASKSTIAT